MFPVTRANTDQNKNIKRFSINGRWQSENKIPNQTNAAEIWENDLSRHFDPSIEILHGCTKAEEECVAKHLRNRSVSDPWRLHR
jgi:hypothetical protein